MQHPHLDFLLSYYTHIPNHNSETLNADPKQPSTKKTTRQAQPVIIDQLLTVSQAAAKLGIGRTKLYDLINTDQIPFVEIPAAGESTKRISALTLNTWIRERETLRHVS